MENRFASIVEKFGSVLFFFVGNCSGCMFVDTAVFSLRQSLWRRILLVSFFFVAFFFY
jgi:Fe-S cluster biogenesis protein NfuA